jgi:hypothetical protein
MGKFVVRVERNTVWDVIVDAEDWAEAETFFDSMIVDDYLDDEIVEQSLIVGEMHELKEV